jgi:hypothetical protein
MWLSMERGEVIVICNLGKDELHVPLPQGKRLILKSCSDVKESDGHVILPKDSIAILSWVCAEP